MHDPAYVAAVRTGVPLGLAESQGFAWDPGLWTMVLASERRCESRRRVRRCADGVAGSLSSEASPRAARSRRRLLHVQWTGARGLAALDDGADSVLILDLDAHCGGGTASLLACVSRVWQVDVSVNDYDRYDDGERRFLTLVHDADDYLAAIERALDLVLRRHPRFGLCLYNAGMDPVHGLPQRQARRHHVQTPRPARALRVGLVPPARDGDRVRARGRIRRRAPRRGGARRAALTDVGGGGALAGIVDRSSAKRGGAGAVVAPPRRRGRLALLRRRLLRHEVFHHRLLQQRRRQHALREHGSR